MRKIQLLILMLVLAGCGSTQVKEEKDSTGLPLTLEAAVDEIVSSLSDEDERQSVNHAMATTQKAALGSKHLGILPQLFNIDGMNSFPSGDAAGAMAISGPGDRLGLCRRLLCGSHVLAGAPSGGCVGRSRGRARELLVMGRSRHCNAARRRPPLRYCVKQQRRV